MPLCWCSSLYQATNRATHSRACSTHSNPLDGYSAQYFSVLNNDSMYGLSTGVQAPVL